MLNVFELPKINPIKLFHQKEFFESPAAAVVTAGFNPNLHSTPMDADAFVNRQKSFEDANEYLQPYQVDDVVRFCWRSGTTSQQPFFTVHALNCDGSTYKDLGNPQVLTVGTINFFYVEIPLHDFAEGKYFFQVRHNDPSYATQLHYIISEPIDIKVKHENTLLFKVTNSYNYHSVLFEQTGIVFETRIHAHLLEPETKSDFEVYEDQKRSLCLLRGNSYREVKLILGGGGKRIPNWFADKFSRFFDCDSVQIDHEFFTRPSGASLEGSHIDNHRLAYYEITLRESLNIDTLDITELGAYRYGEVPKTKRFYVHDLVTGIFAVPVDIQIRRGFESKTAFFGYMNNVVVPAMNFEGVFVEDSFGNLMYLYSSTAEKTALGLWAASTISYLPYWVQVEIGMLSGSTTDSDWFLTGAGNRFIDWGDGATEALGTGGATHTYSNNDIPITVTMYYDNNVSEIITKSGGDYALVSLDAELAPITSVLSSTAEIISLVGRNMLKFADGTFATLDLSDNKLSTEQIDKTIIMLRSGQLKETIAQVGGSLDVRNQTPVSSPNASKTLRQTLSNLSKIWTINYD